MRIPGHGQKGAEEDAEEERRGGRGRNGETTAAARIRRAKPIIRGYEVGSDNDNHRWPHNPRRATNNTVAR
eukprot:8453127-Pyramimonas_sp.AAC.1